MDEMGSCGDEGSRELLDYLDRNKILDEDALAFIIHLLHLDSLISLQFSTNLLFYDFFIKEWKKRDRERER